MDRLPEVIKHLIIINVIVFIVAHIPMPFLNLNAIFPLYFPENKNFEIWQLVTHMFMHANFPHILFNMYGLWAFGTPLAQIWGKNKFLFFYFSVGIGAGIIFTLANYYQFNAIHEQLKTTGLSNTNIQSILDTGRYSPAVLQHVSENSIGEFYNIYFSKALGASGAVYGVLVAFAMYYPNAKLALIFFPVPISAKYFIPLLITFDLFFGMTSYSVGNIAHFAHIGGAIMGFLIAKNWR